MSPRMLLCGYIRWELAIFFGYNRSEVIRNKWLGIRVISVYLFLSCNISKIPVFLLLSKIKVRLRVSVHLLCEVEWNNGSISCIFYYSWATFAVCLFWGGVGGFCLSWCSCLLFVDLSGSLCSCLLVYLWSSLMCAHPQRLVCVYVYRCSCVCVSSSVCVPICLVSVCVLLLRAHTHIRAQSILVCPCVGVHRRTSIMSLSLLLQLCPVWPVCLTRMRFLSRIF